MINVRILIEREREKEREREREREREKEREAPTITDRLAGARIIQLKHSNMPLVLPSLIVIICYHRF